MNKPTGGGTCPKTGKVVLTREDAEDAALRWQSDRMARMNHYRCRHCSGWHIGNDRRKPDQR